MVANTKYTTIKNQYELTFNVNSMIVPVQDDTAIQHQQFNFTKIDQLPQTEVGSTVDVIGIVREASEMSEIISTKMGGKTLQKRELVLFDETLMEVRLTLWGDKASSTMYDWQGLPIVAVKGLRVGEFGGRSLGTTMSSAIEFNPQLPEGSALFAWRQSWPNGQIPTISSVSSSCKALPRKYIFIIFSFKNGLYAAYSAECHVFTDA